MNPFFVVATFIGMLAPVFAPSSKPDLERRVFWVGFLAALISAFFISYPPDGKTGALLSLFVCLLMLIRAYFNTSYIRIRGKIFAFHVERSKSNLSPDGALRSVGANPDVGPATGIYAGLGLTTAKKMWWLVVFLMVLCAGNVVGYVAGRDGPAVAGAAAVFGAIVATAFGYALDASQGYSVARGQRLQFFIASAITFGTFTVFYLAGYYAGKRWPLRRGQSVEYGAHSRHQKRLP